MPSPYGFDLQGPVQDPVIGCWWCSFVGLRKAYSHVSSVKQPPEHWAMHHTASARTHTGLHWITFAALVLTSVLDKAISGSYVSPLSLPRRKCFDWLRLCEESAEVWESAEKSTMYKLLSPAVRWRGAAAHVLHVKVACDVFQKHVRLWLIAGTDMSRLCMEKERGICFEHGINSPFGTGAERSGSRHNKSNVTCNPLFSTPQDTGNM